jgi:3-hydroxyacyl-CoA dehydrogenase/3a,7a,12a-trihydroxy-5b-cholest-24-enoyl-CoA hydratase
MANELRFDGRVAIITGAGGGLGRAHALLLGSRGARVVVNDLGGSMHGGGQSATPADKVVAEIKALGGEAVSNYDSVEDGAKIVQTAMDTWGRIDIVVNNAGILRDTSFPKMSEQDWELIYRVHVLGGFRVTHAAWNHMRDAGYGRIIFTSSGAGVYGNFGQANYSMAKLGLLGLSNTLAIEGKKRGVLVNTIVPIAGSRLTETILPKELTEALRPDLVSPLVAYLCHEDCKETGGAFEVGGGVYTKLRWQRTVGKSFNIGKAVSLENIASSFGEITDFSKATFPADITQSMQPVLTNIGNKSKGGNEFIDVDLALGHEFPPLTTSYDERDLAIYALGVGAAADPLDTKELQYVYEMNGDGFRAVPTYAVVPIVNALVQMAKEGKQAPGLKYGFERILHGEQYTELKRPLPPHGKLTHKAKIKDIFDKGKNAVVVTEARTFDESGEEIAYNELSMLVKGAGGWGGDRGPSGDINVPPAREPDASAEQAVSAGQALLYRLSGDWNPLHVDVNFAKAFGFQRPILHGLCTFGYAARAVLKAFAGNDPGLFKSIRVRFADSVFPGETLITEMWKESDTKIIIRCKVKERDKVVISNAAVELYKEVPAAKKAAPAATAAPAAAPAAAAPAAAAAADTITSADIFVAIGDYISKNPDLVASVNTVFQFQIKSPDSAYSVDVKNGKGGVTEGSAPADVTLELSDADFLAMSSGAVDPQKLYFSGKLKISGNVMASQKLMFLKKVDPAQAKDAVMAARKAKAGAAPGGAKAAAASATAPAASAAAPAASAASAASKAVAYFKSLSERLAKSAELAAEVGAVLAFKVKDPAGSWVVDLKSSPAVVKEGSDPSATTTLELAEEDLLALAAGHSAQDLFQRGKLRISGDMGPAHKLAFLKGHA